MALREKYNHAVQTAKDLKMDGSAEERDGKLYFKGTVRTQADANSIWTAIKTVPDWQKDVVADIHPTSPETGSGAAKTTDASATARPTYTVKSGDTLSKIAKQHLGDANAYMDIFNANRDQLENPDVIKPGQVLVIPAFAKTN